MIGLPHSSVTVIPPAVLPDGGASVRIAVPVTAAHRQRRRHFYAAVLFDKGIAFVKQRSKNRTQDVRFLRAANHTQATNVVVLVRLDASPIRTMNVMGGGEVVIVAAAHNTHITGRSTSRILPARRRTVLIPVPAPFMYIPAHVV